MAIEGAHLDIWKKWNRKEIWAKTAITDMATFRPFVLCLKRKNHRLQHLVEI